jgi:hypothetical protein
MFQWTDGQVLFLYSAGLLLGVSLMVLVQAMSGGVSPAGPLLSILVSLMMPVLPIRAAYRARRRESR